MFEQILGIDILAALLLPVAWGIAGHLAGRLAFRRTRGRLLVSVRITFAVLGLAGLLVVAKLVAIQQFWSYGWLFAHERVIVSLPFIVLPVAATLVCFAPRLWRIARGAVTERRAKVDAASERSGVRPGPRRPHPVNGARRNPLQHTARSSLRVRRCCAQASSSQGSSPSVQPHCGFASGAAAKRWSNSTLAWAVPSGCVSCGRPFRARAGRWRHGLLCVLDAGERVAGPVQHDVS